MEKYAIIKVVNGNFSVDSEWSDDKSRAVATFHSVCATLINTPDVECATVAVVDDRLQTHKYEEIKHSKQ